MAQNIDLSAGLLPAQAAATPGQNIDLSAGLVPVNPSSSGTGWVNTAADVGIGALKGLGQASNSVSRLLNKVPVIGEYLAPTSGIQAAQQIETPTDTAQRIGAGVGNLAGNAALLAAGGELLPEVEGASLAGRVERIGGQAALGSASNYGNGGSPIAGAVLGAGSEGLAQGFNAMAPGVVRSALGIPGKAYNYGKTPAETVLTDIPGVRIGKIAENIQAKLNDLTGQLEQQAASSTMTASTQPALDVIERAQSVARRRRLKSLYNDLEQVKQDFFVKDPFTDNAISKNMTPSELLETKRGIQSLVGQWDPNRNPGIVGTLKQVSGALDSELDRTVPNANELNQKISSLIEAGRRAGVTENNAGVTQQVLNRIARPTGALATADLGAYLGGPTGAAVGLVAPEVISSPWVKMGAARSLYKAPNLTAPVAVSLSDLIGSHSGNPTQ